MLGEFDLETTEILVSLRKLGQAEARLAGNMAKA
jgi:hypothetical protein